MHYKILLEICIKEINASGKPGIAFGAKRWEVDNVKYARFRHQGLEFWEELEIIFGEIVATSQHAWTPAMSVPIEDSAINITLTIPEEIAEYEDEESNPDENASPIVNNQLKRKQMASEAMTKKMANGKQKSGIAGSMLKTLERMTNATESHNAVEAAEMSQTSEISGKW
ncbi:uncharacterized protein LOC133314427 [Gastrolobium bilobum]|uniref:uncharacterized protein LOC133314427 n=1 Tax=Gastrolobium bilobum TaxID=150636 RepID=UPI002AAF343E|nr:uncharacterized protein LOC133314427 [Gastrolobium bilobum]